MAVKKKFTHKGTLVGDARAPRPKEVYLRETKGYFITQSGGRYNKVTGRGTGDWPLYSLSIESVEVLTESVYL